MPQVYYTNGPQSQFDTILLYGGPGAGKTPMASTMESPVIVTSEPGLKSLSKFQIPYVQGRNKKECNDVLHWLETSAETRKFSSVFFDSISALSENVMIEERAKSKDPRQYSPATTNATMEVVNRFMALATNRNVVLTCKAEQENDIDPLTGLRKWKPYTVVPKLGPALPYHFNNVLFMSRHRDTVTQSEYAVLTCRANDICMARNRGDALALYEHPHLGYIIQKLNGVV